MQLIKKIEVHYLRSLYRLEIKDVGDLNVVFGRNDSGKSNLLRALNLFFNGQTEPGRRFDFSLDMSDIRKQEAREAKGKQFIWIKITFDIPENYQNSLGPQIEVKRQWNRDGEMNQTVWPKELREGNPASRLTRFLNDIDFTYIPAIKDITLYSDLVERLYGAASQSVAVAAATKDFVERIGAANESLTKSLQELFGSKSSLSAPTELSQLYRSLDFSFGEEGHSLIRQKGDGIKARHIPEILRSINDGEQRTKLYIWGFEEPENSLDLSAAKAEAARFAQISSRADTQVFLSSHSPAFYLAEAESASVKRFFISKQTKQDEAIRPEDASRPINSLDEAEREMEAAGLLHLPYVIRSLQEMPKKLEVLEAENRVLEEKLLNLTEPTVFFEGKHDLEILEERLSCVAGVQLRELGGTPNTIPALLAAILRDDMLSIGNRALIVFDNDQAGRSAVNKILGTAPIDYAKPNSVAGPLSVMCLPYQHCGHFRDFMNDVGLTERDIIFEGEFLLDACLVAEELSKKSFDRERIHETYYSKPQGIYLKMQKYEEGTPGWLFSRTVPDEHKKEVIDAVKGCGQTPSLDALIQTITDFMA
ncbi:AAA family ATPase [Roseibacterium sp. SDUM158017]|uniref:ATP-dependent nuclease n=1 Tax=Roseicyclus salinarum TaxID=3036773 RepID=UPI00241506D0|nr:AAA family ATPase [Roseibacterium sp. SDUM158017]MDG4649448.1 AAA family ATPase [Roseibacterium sp. SDUM158017]